jgi:serine/threonine protein kinase
MTPTNPKYLPKDTSPQSSVLSTFTVLRVSDQETFVAARIPNTLVADPPPQWHNPSKKQVTTPLAPILIREAGVSISRILNHPNIVALIDIVQTSEVPGAHVPAPLKKNNEIETPSDFTVWEDMNAGCLSLLLPSPNSLPSFGDGPGWYALASLDYQRFSLPEGLCWHVLLNISKALLWLHCGMKETNGIPGDFKKHDDDWHPILIRDISPGQIWFKHPRADEHYGECKLGGFQWAKVTGNPESKTAIVPRKEEASIAKQYYWAPVCLFSSPAQFNQDDTDG